MMCAQIAIFEAKLYAVLIRADGTHRDYGCVSSAGHNLQPSGFLRALWRKMRRRRMIPFAMGFAAFVGWLYRQELALMAPVIFGLVTDGGIDFLMQDFAAAGGIDITNMNFQGTGTGTTAENVTQTDLVTPIAVARVAGAQTHPAVKQYQTVATVPYTGTLTVNEWALFSAAGSGLPPVGGTMWDRRVVAPGVGVNNGDSITFTYLLTGASGGT